MNHDQYMRMEEDAAIGSYLDKIEETLKSLNEGRNLRCWPLCSFGWKDADLDPGGCTGIAAITGYSEDNQGVETFKVKVGGHRTISPYEESEDDSVNEEKTESIQELVIGCGYPGEWAGDEWVLGFEDEIEVKSDAWLRANDGTMSDEEVFRDIAKAIKQAAEDACNPFESAMSELTESIDSLYSESDQI